MRSRSVASICKLHRRLKTASVALIMRSYTRWIELSWQSSLLVQHGRHQYGAAEAWLTGTRCVLEPRVLRSYAIPSASGGGRRLGCPVATCCAISHTLTSCVRLSSFLALLVEPKAQLLVLYGLGRCIWHRYAAFGARGPRGRPEGALACAARGGLHRASAQRAECAGLVSSALWDRRPGLSPRPGGLSPA